MRQPRDHREDPISHSLQLSIDLIQRPRRFEHIEMPVERNFISNLRLLMIYPCIGRVRQHFALKVDIHVFIERNIFRITQR